MTARQKRAAALARERRRAVYDAIRALAATRQPEARKRALARARAAVARLRPGEPLRHRAYAALASFGRAHHNTHAANLRERAKRAKRKAPLKRALQRIRARHKARTLTFTRLYLARLRASMRRAAHPLALLTLDPMRAILARMAWGTRMAILAARQAHPHAAAHGAPEVWDERAWQAWVASCARPSGDPLDAPSGRSTSTSEPDYARGRPTVDPLAWESPRPDYAPAGVVLTLANRLTRRVSQARATMARRRAALTREARYDAREYARLLAWLAPAPQPAPSPAPLPAGYAPADPVGPAKPWAPDVPAEPAHDPNGAPWRYLRWGARHSWPA